MAEQLPTASEVFGSSDPGQIPTASEAFADVQEQTLGLGKLGVPSLSSATRDAARIYQAFTGSASRAFGEEPLTHGGFMELSPETEQALRKGGIWNDYERGQKDFFAEHRERAWKALAGTVNTTIRAGEAAIAAPIGAFGQFLENIGVLSQEDFEAALADPGVLMAVGPFGEAGALMVNARRAANLRVEIPKSRASAVIGEGEAGYFEARELTPENAQARVEAAREAGIPAPVPEPVAPDVHVLARRVNPPAFEQFDALEAAKGAHRETIQTLAASREAIPEAVQAQAAIKAALDKIQAAGWKVTEASGKRLTEAQERLARVLDVETPEILRARKALLAADEAQKALLPEIASAYRQSREMMPPIEKQVAEATEELSAGRLPEEIGLPPTKEIAAPPQVLEEGAAGPRITGTRPLQGTGPLKTRGLSENIEASAIEANLTQSFGDLPEYHQLSMADQARLATEFVATKPDEALAVALGEKAAPKGLSPASVLVMVEKQAQAAGDVETLRRLATESRLTTTATEAGRFIRILGERDPTSAAGAMHLVQEARRAALEKRNATALKDAAKEIRATMRKNAPTRDAWATFIQEIVCKE